MQDLKGPYIADNLSDLFFRTDPHPDPYINPDPHIFSDPDPFPDPDLQDGLNLSLGLGPDSNNSSHPLNNPYPDNDLYPLHDNDTDCSTTSTVIRYNPSAVSVSTQNDDALLPPSSVIREIVLDSTHLVEHKIRPRCPHSAIIPYSRYEHHTTTTLHKTDTSLPNPHPSPYPDPNKYPNYYPTPHPHPCPCPYPLSSPFSPAIISGTTEYARRAVCVLRSSDESSTLFSLPSTLSKEMMFLVSGQRGADRNIPKVRIVNEGMRIYIPTPALKNCILLTIISFRLSLVLISYQYIFNFTQIESSLLS